MNHEYFMAEALRLAREAIADGDVPVGCVIVKDGQIIGRGRNRREADRDATAHAEVEAIREACARLGSWRLQGCTLPHVRRGHHQRPDQRGALRRAGGEVRVLRVGTQPV